MESFAEQNRFGRIARVPTPTPYAGLGDINCYVVLPAPHADGPVLIDTGVKTEQAWDVLRKGLDEFGIDIGDIALVLLTHAHPDHCGQASRIAREAGCEIWIHEAADRTFARYTGDLTAERTQIVEEQMARFGVPLSSGTEGLGSPGTGHSNDLIEPFEPDRLLRDGDVVEIAGYDLEVVHTPGHCPEEVVFWQADDAAILSGDHLLPNITPICLMNFPEEPGGERVSSLLQYRDSLERAEMLPARTTYPSHGPVIDDHRALIASYRLHMEKRTLKLLRLLENGGATVFGLAQRMFPNVWQTQLYLVLSEVIGHLDLLVADGRAAIQRAPDGPALQYVIADPGGGR